MINSKFRRIKRHSRVRKRIIGSTQRPRLSVFRSNKHIYAQLINDSEAKTLAAISDATLSKGEKSKGGKLEIAFEVGQKLAAVATGKKIKQVVFDRGGYRFHGRVKALAEGAKKGGLSF